MTVHGVSEDGRRAIVGMTIPFVLATVAVILRFISRRSSKNLGLDDWCCLFAYISFIALYLTSMVWVTSGSLGWPMAEVGVDGVNTFLKFAFASEILYTLVCPAVKLSFLLFYSRIFDTRTFRTSLVAVVTAIMLWFFASFFATILQCQPVHAFWNVLEYPEKCIDGQKVLLGTSSTNVVLNLIVVAMPIPIVLRLDLSLAQKVILFAMLCLGLLITIFSILRTYYVSKINRLDITLSLVDTIIWTIVEPGMVIFCACLPSIPHLIAKFHERAQARNQPKFSVMESRGSSSEEIVRHSMLGKLYSEMFFADKPLPVIRHEEVSQHEVYQQEIHQQDVEIAMPDKVEGRDFVMPPRRYGSRVRDPFRNPKRWSSLGITAATKQFTIHK